MPIQCVDAMLAQDVNLDGPVPREFCALTSLRELDLDGAQQTAIRTPAQEHRKQEVTARDQGGGQL
eukprot:scaffold75015_cov18-Tisochrysis_lutea.AAC.2